MPRPQSERGRIERGRIDRGRIERELETTAPPDALWRAVSDAERLGDWLEAEVELEVRPGGTGRFTFADGEERRAMVETVDPGRELTFSWWRSDPTGMATDPATTTVSFLIEATPGGGARLRLREVAAVHVRAATGGRARALAGVVA